VPPGLSCEQRVAEAVAELVATRQGRDDVVHFQVLTGGREPSSGSSSG
jgi:hypothetical protein